MYSFYFIFLYVAFGHYYVFVCVCVCVHQLMVQFSVSLRNYCLFFVHYQYYALWAVDIATLPLQYIAFLFLYVQ